MSDDIITRLALIALQLNRIVPIFQIAFGTVGNIMNILIFTRRSHPNNPSFQIFFLVITCAFPPIPMGVFGALAIFNVKRLRKQASPQNNDA
ncbi:unnamed protein product [Rotaria socialis]|uniref:Uncharacterized protein n=1 Tax=Rotaria socialis TaxID=392032 RepID=A0A820ZPQ7_9BILA|nr:unnamed protein product [Rotaria socialis]